uniref:Brix domain-containing protein n=1 Tax=Caenorhabditis tropicalis TaxID=1561998 RepID=A0A1I7UJC2_9PELO
MTITRKILKLDRKHRNSRVLSSGGDLKIGGIEEYLKTECPDDVEPLETLDEEEEIEEDEEDDDAAVASE